MTFRSLITYNFLALAELQYLLFHLTSQGNKIPVSTVKRLNSLMAAKSDNAFFTRCRQCCEEVGEKGSPKNLKTLSRDPLAMSQVRNPVTRCNGVLLRICI